MSNNNQQSCRKGFQHLRRKKHGANHSEGTERFEKQSANRSKRTGMSERCREGRQCLRHRDQTARKALEYMINREPETGRKQSKGTRVFEKHGVNCCKGIRVLRNSELSARKGLEFSA